MSKDIDDSDDFSHIIGLANFIVEDILHKEPNATVNTALSLLIVDPLTTINYYFISKKQKAQNQIFTIEELISELYHASQKRKKYALAILYVTPKGERFDELKKLLEKFSDSRMLWKSLAISYRHLTVDENLTSQLQEVIDTTYLQFHEWLNAKLIEFESEDGSNNSKMSYKPLNWKINVNQLTYLFEVLRDKKFLDFGGNENLKRFIKASFVTPKGYIGKDILTKSLKNLTDDTSNKTQNPLPIENVVNTLIQKESGNQNST